MGTPRWQSPSPCLLEQCLGWADRARAKRGQGGDTPVAGSGAGPLAPPASAAAGPRGKGTWVSEVLLQT